MGLKNVGQTCWFSAVIQSLFHIPAFRNLVLNFHPPPEFVSNPEGFTNGRSLDDERRKKTEFMLELRKLFALMLASTRKYVDPSRAVDILRGNIGASSANGNRNNDNNQQDVSEFTHIVLDWLEDAFKTPVTVEKSGKDEKMEEGDGQDSSESQKASFSVGGGDDGREKAESETNPEPGPSTNGEVTKNPMTRLFYGNILVEGKLKGEYFSRPEAFGQYPLQVNSNKDVHEALETSTAHELLETANSTAAGIGGQESAAVSESGQERLFTELPPVLFLSLSRFQFNQERGMAEKIHNRLDFPETLYMDRYMAGNKHVTREKRDQVRSLKERRVDLASRLEKYTHYGPKESPENPGGGGEKMALANILQSAMDFASASSPENAASSPSSTAVPDISMASPPSATQPGSSGATTSSAAGTSSTSAAPSSANAHLLSSLMQVDSPCGSPKTMTPATSLSNLAKADEDESMEVEDSADPVAPQPSAPAGANCDTLKEKSLPPSGPFPKYISETELRVIQVRDNFDPSKAVQGFAGLLD